MSLFDRVRGWLGARTDASGPSTHLALPSAPQATGRGANDFRAGGRYDSILNELTGMGTAGDKSQAGRPNQWVIPLTDDELRAQYLYNGVAHRIVTMPADKATRKGWASSHVPPSEEQRLHVFERCCDAMTWASLYGGAGMMLVVDEEIPASFTGTPTQWLATPLDLSKVRKLEALQVFDSFEAYPQTFDTSLRSSNFRGPLLWQISTSNFLAQVHASRVVWFRGTKRPPSDWRGGFGRSNRMLDNSVLQTVWEQVRNLSETMQAGAVLAQEIRQTLVKISGLAAINTSDQAAALQERLALMAQSQSLLNIVVLDENDEHETRSNPPTGFEELSEAALTMLCTVLGWPRTMLTGEAPGGLSTDDENGAERERQVINSFQEKHRKAIERIYTVMCAAKEGPTRGVIPPDLALVFAPIDEPSTKEKAEARSIIAQIDADYITAGVYTAADVARSRFGPEGYSDEMLPVEVPEDEPEEVPAPSPAPGAPQNTAPNGAPMRDAYPERRDASGDGMFVLMPAPDPGLSLRTMIEMAIGQRLDIPAHAPHVTVLYVGEGIRPRFELPEVISVIEDEATDVESRALCGGVLRAFPPGPRGTPIVIELQEAWAVQLLHERLLRRLAHRITQRQHRAYRPHVTIGYAPDLVTVEAMVKLIAIDVSAYVVPITVFEISSDGKTVATFAAGAEPVRP